MVSTGVTGQTNVIALLVWTSYFHSVIKLRINKSIRQLFIDQQMRCWVLRTQHLSTYSRVSARLLGWQVLMPYISERSQCKNGVEKIIILNKAACFPGKQKGAENRALRDTILNSATGMEVLPGATFRKRKENIKLRAEPSMSIQVSKRCKLTLRSTVSEAVASFCIQKWVIRSLTTAVSVLYDHNETC